MKFQQLNNIKIYKLPNDVSEEEVKIPKLLNSKNNEIKISRLFGRQKQRFQSSEHCPSSQGRYHREMIQPIHQQQPGHSCTEFSDIAIDSVQG